MEDGAKGDQFYVLYNIPPTGPKELNSLKTRALFGLGGFRIGDRRNGEPGATRISLTMAKFNVSRQKKPLLGPLGNV